MARNGNLVVFEWPLLLRFALQLRRQLAATASHELHHDGCQLLCRDWNWFFAEWPHRAEV